MPPVLASHTTVNGCGDDTGLGRLVPNQPVGVDFRPVCDNHDRCYGTLGKTRQDCDNRFRSALRAKCESELLGEVGGVFSTVLTGGQALTACYGTAEIYYRAVRERGGEAYSKAQRHAREERAAQNCGNNIEIRATNGNLEFPRGTSWRTCNGYTFIFQEDQNLVLYNPSGKAIWATGTNGKGANILAFQTDGNMVLYASGGRAIWDSKTHRNPGAFLAVQTDGNVVIYTSAGRAIWATGTNGR